MYLDAGADPILISATGVNPGTDRCFCVAHKGPIRSRRPGSPKLRHEESRRVARGRSGPDTTRNILQNKSSMEPARSPQEPPVYVSPQSREEQQLVKELQNITGLEAHVAQRRSHRRPAPRSDRVGGVWNRLRCTNSCPGVVLSVRPCAIDATPLRYHHRHCQYTPQRGPLDSEGHKK